MVYIYDIECMKNLFLVCFQHKETRKRFQFEISDYKQNTQELLKFLKQDKLMLVGYNNLNYDSQLIEYLLKHPLCTYEQLYSEGQRVINNKYPDIPYWKLSIPNLDLFKLKHYDRYKVSLKWCQFGLDWENLQDLPYKHDQILTETEIQNIRDYCWNDVDSTHKLYEYCSQDIDLRKSIKKMYNQECFNLSNTGIAKKLVLNDLSKALSVPTWELKKVNTKRESVYFDEIISPIIKFSTKPLIDFLANLKKSNKNLVTDSFKFEVNTKFMKHTIARGGIHSISTPKIFKSDKESIVLDLDYGSFYPNQILQMKFSPKHLGSSFLSMLDKLTTQRLKAKKNKKLGVDIEKNGFISDALKISINSIYGLLGEPYSFLHDFKTMYSVTINGQLLLLMLIEKLESIGGKCIYSNTDGASFIIPRNRKQEFINAAEETKSYFNCELEYVEFEKFIVRDVNNILVKYEGGIKRKGIFEYGNLPLQKNKSCQIIAIALEKYFLENISIDKTIKAHDKIEDFFIAKRAGHSPKRGKATFIYNSVENGKFVSKPLQKTIRYIVSNSGGTLIKKYADNSTELVNVHPIKGKVWKQSILNRYSKKTSIDNYNINYSYYISETNKIINLFNENQLNLFE